MPNDAIRRIMAEVKEFATLNSHPSSFFYAAPLESDLFEWHFSVRGPPDTPFSAGIYHGRILLPAEYPLKPPEIILLTPNGRFEVGKRICLSVTAHHQETWQPSWGIRTILTALVGFMPSKAEGVGALDYPDEDRRGLARKSLHFKCPRCGVRPVEQLPPREIAGSSGSSGKSSVKQGKQCGKPDGDNDGNAEAKTVNESGNCGGDVVGTRKPNNVGDVFEERKKTTYHTGMHTKCAEQQYGMGLKGSTVVQDEVKAVVNVAGQPSAADADTDAITPQEVMPAQVDQHSNRTESKRKTGNIATSEALGVQLPGEQVQEKELLYVAYAIVFLMLAIVVRRVINIVIS